MRRWPRWRSVNARAQDYEDSGAFGATRMDVLRAYAYLDLLNGVSPTRGSPAPRRRTRPPRQPRHWPGPRPGPPGTAAEAGTDDAARRDGAAASRTGGDARLVRPHRTRRPRAAAGGGPVTDDGPGGDDCRVRRPRWRLPAGGGCDDPAATGAAGPRPRHDAGERGGDSAAARRRDGDDDEPGDDDPATMAAVDQGGDPGPGGPAWPAPGRASARRAGRCQQRPPDLAVPLATLLGLAERPGEIQGLGPVDPALARRLAAAAAASPRTQVCVTVTSPEGYATGHGCARLGPRLPARPGQPPRPRRPRRAARPPQPHHPGHRPARPRQPPPPLRPVGAHPARQPGPRRAPQPRPTDRLTGQAGPPGGAGPPDGYGTWTLTTPGGRRFTVRLDPVPTYACDHRHETCAYQPGDKLRHLVQVRDGACTFPPCNRHARDSDFDHAQPYDKGGSTCACNAGARSRACHQRQADPRGGHSPSPNPAGTNGRPQPAASTSRNPGDTQPDRLHAAHHAR